MDADGTQEESHGSKGHMVERGRGQHAYRTGLWESEGACIMEVGKVAGVGGKGRS